MPFRLTNVAATFQDYINKILAGKLNIFVIIYFDNILIYTESERKTYIETVWWVLNPLLKYLLYANLKKYGFHQQEVRFLGYIFFHEAIRIEEGQIKIMCD